MAINKSFDFKNIGEITSPQEMIHAQDLYGMIGATRGFGIISGCAVTRTTNQIDIASGEVLIGATIVSFTADNVTVDDTSMSSGQHRWTNIYITSGGAIGKTDGTAVPTGDLPKKTTDTTNLVICSALKEYGDDLSDDRVIPAGVDMGVGRILTGSTTIINQGAGGNPNFYSNNTGQLLSIDSQVTLSSHLRILDNKSIIAGSSDDFSIAHDTSNTYLTNTTGSLFIRNETAGSNHLYLDTHGAVLIRDRDDGDAQLFNLDTTARTLAIGADADEIITTHYGGIGVDGPMAIVPGGSPTPNATIGMTILPFFSANDNYYAINAMINASSTGTIPSATGLFTRINKTGGSGVMTNAYGIRIDDPNITGGTITTSYGLHMESMTSGGTNYSIWTGLGTVRFGDTLRLSSVVNASTDTDKFLVLDSSNNVDFRTGSEVASDIGITSIGSGAIITTAERNALHSEAEYFPMTTLNSDMDWTSATDDNDYNGAACADTNMALGTIVAPKTGTISIGFMAGFIFASETHTWDCYYSIITSGGIGGGWDVSDTTQDLTVGGTGNEINKVDMFTSVSVTKGQMIMVRYVHSYFRAIYFKGFYIEYTA